MNLAWMISAGTAAGLGMIVGGAIAWQWCSSRAMKRQRRLVATAREQYATGTQGLRATNARLQASLDKEKLAIQGRLAAAAADHRAELVRLEGQLRFAYAEIDRLQARGTGEGAAPGAPTDAHGFALTRPFER